MPSRSASRECLYLNYFGFQNRCKLSAVFCSFIIPFLGKLNLIRMLFFGGVRLQSFPVKLHKMS